MESQKFKDIISSKEGKKVEFKGKTNFKNFKEHFTIALCSMANIAGGGLIIIGINDQTYSLESLSDEEIKSFDKKKIYDYIKNHVSPLPQFNMEEHEEDGKKFLIFHVLEFSEMPHILTNLIEFNGKKYLPGDIIIRTESSESRRIKNENEMRELISLSLRKRSELLLSEINDIITGKIQKIEIEPNELFNNSILNFNELASDFKKEYKGIAYWKFQFVPIPLVNRNITLKEHLRNSVVSNTYMMSFPSYNYSEHEIRFIHDSLFLSNNREYWRLSNSLCYGSYRVITSETVPQNPGLNYPPPPNRPIFCEIVIIDLINFFSFCKNLIFNENINSVWINIELYNVKNRYIGSKSLYLDHIERRKCYTESINHDLTISKGLFISSYKDIAIENILKIFRNFQIDFITRETIFKIYDNYINGK